ncbi:MULTISPECIES: DRTGG domain-containing protein [unclassified Paenibacillus]|uniref:DRTGG domain-containing protein n=2 Tax=Paenibacillus TaxID=44249 RepID=UPI001EE9EF76|nr:MULTISPECIES: DRTGG domain-containing protein [unclassified Paenibacillus]
MMTVGPADFSTKHDQIIAYMESLEVGSRVSVRKLAQTLEVSEGTAYRAIKDAEAKGIVSTKLRTGTVRVDSGKRERIDKLTFEEIVGIVDGHVLGGQSGLPKTLNKFVIGAMQLEAMMGYIEPGNLLIVGNREKAHHSALSLGAGVLVTGGFGTSAEVIALADRLELPVLGSSYDTFTVAALINRAIYDRLIKKQIVLVGDILRTDMPPAYLHDSDRVGDAMSKIEETNHNRFPVVDNSLRPVGMVTTKDLIGAELHQPISERMTTEPKTVSPGTSVATAGHMMVAEAIELLPVTDSAGKLTGVISRKDVLRAMQQIQHQPQNGETLEDQMRALFSEERDEEGRLYYEGPAAALMSNQIGSMSEGVMSGLIHQAAVRAIKEHRRSDLITDSHSVYYLAPVEIDQILRLYPTIIEISRKFCKAEVQVFAGERKVAQSMLTARLME